MKASMPPIIRREELQKEHQQQVQTDKLPYGKFNPKAPTPKVK